MREAMPFRHHPADEDLFAAMLRTEGDPRRLTRLAGDAGKDIRVRQLRARARSRVLLIAAAILLALCVWSFFD
ncbi:MAG: hypothetical protein ACWA6X_10935 [Bauldia sp.]